MVFHLKKIIIFVLALGIFTRLTTPALAKDPHAGSSAKLSESEAEKPVDDRADRLKAFLESYKSPLAEYAEDFVKIADEYGLDWKIIPIISGIESTFGKHYPVWSNNPFGWGIYGDQVLSFKSIPDAIRAVAKGLSDKYPEKALKDVYLLGRIYNGVTPSSWSNKFKFFMQKLASQTAPIASLDLSL